MAGENELGWLVELYNTAPGLVIALGPTGLAIYAMLYATKGRSSEPENHDAGQARVIELLEKIAANTGKSAAHAERIEGIEQRNFEEALRQGAKKE